MTHRSQRHPNGPTRDRLRLWVIAAAAAALAPSAIADDREDTWDRFRVLAERNLFVRDRRPRLPQPRGPIRHAPAPRPTPRFVLTGIARHREAFVAFFENVANGETVRARAGDTVGGGVVQSITMDGVDHAVDGTVTPIEVGETLTGEPPPPRESVGPIAGKGPVETADEEAAQQEGTPEDADPEAASTAPDDPPTPETEPASETDLTDILQRLRQRREQELKK